MSERKIGYTLLSCGITTMLISVVTMILLLTKTISPVSFFNIPSPSINTASLVPSVPGLPSPKGEKIEIIPTEAFNTMLNVGVTFLLMTFIMSFGFKLGDLGVKLLRPIKIEGKA